AGNSLSGRCNTKCSRAVGIGLPRPGRASLAEGIVRDFLNENMATVSIYAWLYRPKLPAWHRFRRTLSVADLTFPSASHRYSVARLLALWSCRHCNGPVEPRSCHQLLGGRFMRYRILASVVTGVVFGFAHAASAQQPAAAPPPTAYGSPGIKLDQAKKAAEAAE